MAMYIPSPANLNPRLFLPCPDNDEDNLEPGMFGIKSVDGGSEAWYRPFKNAVGDADPAPIQLLSTSSNPLNNQASVDPTVNDDSGDGYSVFSLWHNISSNIVYMLVDPTVGNAVWVITSITDSDDITEGSTNRFISATQELYINRIVSNNLYGEVATVSTATFSVNGTYGKLLVTYTDTGEVTLTFDASLKTNSNWAGVLIIDKGEGAYINNISMYISGESDPFAIIDIDGDQVRVCSDGTNMVVEGFEE